MISPRNEAGPDSPDAVMPVNPLKSEAELRTAVIDRLIAASLKESKPAWEATLERWRTIDARRTELDSTDPKVS